MPLRGAGLVDYFSSVEDRLSSAGLTVTMADIDSESTVAENAAAISALVGADPRPVCFLTHSKGGLDVLHFLLQASVEERGMVACWIALQAPFAGSPIADWVTDRWLLPRVLDLPLAVLGGGIETIELLRTDNRRTYLANNDSAIRRILQQVPMLSVATVLDPEDYPLVPNAAVVWTLRQIHGPDRRNDGIVSVASSILPYSRYVVIDGLDHGMTSGLDPVSGDYDTVALIQALLVITVGDSRE